MAGETVSSVGSSSTSTIEKKKKKAESSDSDFRVFGNSSDKTVSRKKVKKELGIFSAEQSNAVYDSKYIKSRPDLACTDDCDDGQITGSAKRKALLRGAGGFFANMCTERGKDGKRHFSLKNTLITAGVVVGASIAHVATAGLSTAALVAYGAGSGALKIHKGHKAIKEAKEIGSDAAAKAAWENIGEGATELGVSLLGAKAAVKGVKNAPRSYKLKSNWKGHTAQKYTMKLDKAKKNLGKYEKVAANADDAVSIREGRIAELEAKMETQSSLGKLRTRLKIRRNKSHLKKEVKAQEKAHNKYNKANELVNPSNEVQIDVARNVLDQKRAIYNQASAKLRIAKRTGKGLKKAQKAYDDAYTQYKSASKDLRALRKSENGYGHEGTEAQVKKQAEWQKAAENNEHLKNVKENQATGDAVIEQIQSSDKAAMKVRIKQNIADNKAATQGDKSGVVKVDQVAHIKRNISSNKAATPGKQSGVVEADTKAARTIYRNSQPKSGVIEADTRANAQIKANQNPHLHNAKAVEAQNKFNPDVAHKYGEPTPESKQLNNMYSKLESFYAKEGKFGGVEADRVASKTIAENAAKIAESRSKFNPEPFHKVGEKSPELSKLAAEYAKLETGKLGNNANLAELQAYKAQYEAMPEGPIKIELGKEIIQLEASLNRQVANQRIASLKADLARTTSKTDIEAINAEIATYQAEIDATAGIFKNN